MLKVVTFKVLPGITRTRVTVYNEDEISKKKFTKIFKTQLAKTKRSQPTAIYWVDIYYYNIIIRLEYGRVSSIKYAD